MDRAEWSGSARERTFLAGDSVRAVAALAVLAYHVAFTVAAQATPWRPSNPDFRVALGDVGVVFLRLDLGLYVFFVLSGYLLSRPYLASLRDGRPLPSFPRYARNRLMRIIPAFWVVLTVVLVVRVTLGYDLESSPLEILSIYGFAQNFNWSSAAYLMGQAWTLHLELAFYLLLPVVAWAVHRLARDRTISTRTILVGLAVLWIASIAIRHWAPETRAWRFNLAAMLFAFVPGVALAAIEPHAAPRLARWGPGRALSAALGAAGLLALVAYHLAAPLAQGFQPQAAGSRAVLASLGTGLLVAAPLVWQWTTGRAGVYANPVLHWLGQRSYSFYLLHVPVIFALEGRLAHFSPKRALVVGLVAATALTTAAAAASFAFIEQPFLNKRRSITARTRPAVEGRTRVPDPAMSS